MEVAHVARGSISPLLTCPSPLVREALGALPLAWRAVAESPALDSLLVPMFSHLAVADASRLGVGTPHSSPRPPPRARDAVAAGGRRATTPELVIQEVVPNAGRPATLLPPRLGLQTSAADVEARGQTRLASAVQARAWRHVISVDAGHSGVASSAGEGSIRVSRFAEEGGVVIAVARADARVATGAEAAGRCRRAVAATLRAPLQSAAHQPLPSPDAATLVSPGGGGLQEIESVGVGRRTDDVRERGIAIRLYARP